MSILTIWFNYIKVFRQYFYGVNYKLINNILVRVMFSNKSNLKLKY